MSDDQSDHLSAAGSSLSLFSGLGASTVGSGASESVFGFGGVPANVDELSDERLEQVVDEAKAALRSGGGGKGGKQKSTAELPRPQS